MTRPAITQDRATKAEHDAETARDLLLRRVLSVARNQPRRLPSTVLMYADDYNRALHDVSALRKKVQE